MSGSNSGPLNYPIVMTRAGVLPQPPAALLAQLIQLVNFGTDALGNQVMTPMPGYTANLPGSLIEDISSTDTAALVVCDQARVELINSLTPFGANAFLMSQLGQLFGIPSGTTENVQCTVIFTGTVGFMIQAGFVVSDGTHTYVVQQGGIIGASGSSAPLLAVSPQAGSFPCPAGTVTQFGTSVPLSITLSVTNPLDGTGGNTTETEQAYRLRVLQASVVACQGTPAFLKTLLQAIPGVVPNQVAVQSAGAGWKVICGGSSPDPYAIANAIYQAVPSISSLASSVMGVGSVTQANPGLVTTVLNHGYASGQGVTFSGCLGMVSLNIGVYTVTVIDEKTFTIGVNTTALPAYTGGGVVAPNLRNNLISITDYPDIYQIPFVTPPSQLVAVVLTWNAASSIASGPVVSQLAQGAIVTFVNAVPAGAPLNLLAMQEAVMDAVDAVIDRQQISKMIWSVSINNVTTAPSAGTSLIFGDSESYFQTSPASVTVAQG
jgi:hypothetical protein